MTIFALGGKARLHITGKDRAVAHLRCDDLIHRQQRTLAQMAIRIVLIGVGRRRAARLAVELGGIRITTTVDHLGRQTREKRLCPFSPVQQMELTFRLCSDQNWFDGFVESIRNHGFGKTKLCKLSSLRHNCLGNQLTKPILIQP